MTDVVYDGKWCWHGALLPEGSNDPDEQRNFVVFADSLTEALGKIDGEFVGTMFAEMRDGYELVFLSRGPASDEMEIPTNLVSIGEATKH
jgi:hypothetical protein